MAAKTTKFYIIIESNDSDIKSYGLFETEFEAKECIKQIQKNSSSTFKVSSLENVNVRETKQNDSQKIESVIMDWDNDNRKAGETITVKQLPLRRNTNFESDIRSHFNGNKRKPFRIIEDLLG